MDSARRDKSIGFLCLCITAFGWVLNWPLMKLLLQQWRPLFARGLAGVCASLILAALILGEPLGQREVAAMARTLGGVTLALQRA